MLTQMSGEMKTNDGHHGSRLLSLVREMYSTETNEQRVRCTQQLMELEKHLSSSEITEAGIGLLQLSNDREAVQAYGAVLLKNGIESHRVAPDQLPLSDLATWYRTEPTLRKLLISDLINLLVCGAIYGPDNVIDGLIASLCSHVQITREERGVMLLSQLVQSFMEPEFNTIPRERVSWLRRKMKQHASLILKRISEVLYEYYVALVNLKSETTNVTTSSNNNYCSSTAFNNNECNSGNASSPPHSPSTPNNTGTNTTTTNSGSHVENKQHSWVQHIHVDKCIESCLYILATLLPHTSLALWNDIALMDTMSTLLRWPQSQRSAIMTIASLLRSSSCFESHNNNNINSYNNMIKMKNGGNNNINNNEMAGQEFILRQLFMVVIEVVPSCVRTRDIGVLTEVIELLEEMPLPLMTSLNWGSATCEALLQILDIPSVQFAGQICNILVKCDRHVYELINSQTLYSALHFHVIKDQFHPERGTHADGVALSQEQFGFVHMYESAFAEMRGQCGKLMEQMAQVHPDETTRYILELLLHLPDASGTPNDPRTNKHYVTHDSSTYKDWEAREYMVHHLSESFRYTSTYVAECIEALVPRQPRDAVLLPLFFNMLSSLWRCKEDVALNVWNGTVQILFSCIECNTWDEQDADESAARRRAHTLLVQLAIEHGTQCAPIAINIIKRIEPLLLRSSNVERTLLYEALIAFTSALPSSAESESYMRSIVHPLLSILVKSITPLTQEKFNAMMVAQSGEERTLRDRIRDTLNVLSAVLRRSRMTPYVVEMSTQLAEVLTQIVLWLHHMDPSALPPGFEYILEMEGAERVQFLPGKSRQSSIVAAQKEKEMERNDSPQHHHHHHHQQHEYNNRNNNRNSYYNLLSAVRQARGAVISIRLSVYQLFGALSPLLPDEQFAPVLHSLHGALSLPLHAMRSLSERCLFVIAEQHPLLLTQILTLLSEFYAKRANSLYTYGNETDVQSINQPDNINNNQFELNGFNGNNSMSMMMMAQRQRQRSRAMEEQDVIDCKQWLFYTKDVLTFLRKNVIDSRNWCKDAQLLRTLAQLTVNMLRSNSELRGCLRLMMTLLELRCTEPNTNINTTAHDVNTVTTNTAMIMSGNASNMQTLLLETQLFVYSHLLYFVIHVDEAILPPRERENIAYMITDPYIRFFPTLSRAMESIGLTRDEVDELHADLIIAGKVAVQRRRLKEFILRRREHT